MASVVNRFIYRQESFRGNTHDQECLPGHQDILHWVEEVREHVHIYLRVEVHGMITDDDAQEHDVQNSKCKKALMERGFHFWPFEDHG